MFDLDATGARLFAAASAFAITTLVMAFAIVPATPTGVFA